MKTTIKNAAEMNTETTTKELTPHQIKRQKLRELSAQAKDLQEAEFPELKINQIIIDQFYKTDEHQEFHTLPEWNKKGYIINPGAQSFVVWGKPTAAQKLEQNPEAVNEDEDKFFPLCYLFSNAQVTPKANA